MAKVNPVKYKKFKKLQITINHSFIKVVNGQRTVYAQTSCLHFIQVENKKILTCITFKPTRRTTKLLQIYLEIESLYRVSQEECAKLRDSVSYVKVYRYNPKHLCPNLNAYGDNGQRSLKL